VLLLVLQAQFHQRLQGPSPIGQSRRWVFQELGQPVVDPPAPVQNCAQAWPGQQTPLGARMAGAGGLVIGIEQIAPKGIQAGPPFKVGRKHKTVKEPVRMGQVPFGGAGVRHALQAEVLRLQRNDQPLAVLADGAPALVAGQVHRRATIEAPT
jgi:hypothetical protein